MVSDRAGMESTKQILGGLGAQVGVSLATQVVVNIFDKMLGNSYSKSSFKRYTELKRVYAKMLGKDAPHFWDLDDKNRPIFRIGNHKWHDYVRDLGEGKESNGNYSNQSAAIASYISTYLAERGRRWFGSGNPGDVLELFMSEWIHFALNELPTYRFDELSINKIKDRLKYVVKVQKHEALFKFGFIRRKKNKFDTMESVRQELLECERRAKRQASRECAREKFKVCRDSTTDLLMACVNSIYYARTLPVYSEPLNLRTLVDPNNSFLTRNAKELYPAVKSTHTGAMLLEVVQLSGLEAFDISSLTEIKAFNPVYFNKNFSPKPVNWSAGSHDLPKWFGKEEAQRYLLQTQLLAETALRIAKLKGLVDDVYDLTGQLGDLWAYGDKRGKLALEALLFLLEKELELFYERYEALYQYQDSLRQTYTLAHSVNQNDAANKNFNRVDNQKGEIDKYYGRLKVAINELRTKLSEFSEEEARRIDDRKKLFYQAVASHVNLYYPADYHRFQLLEQPLSQEEAVVAFGLDAPLLDSATVAEEPPLTWLASFFPGERFTAWRKKYFKHHKNEYLSLAQSLLQFENQINENGPFEKINEKEKEIQSQLEQMRFKVAAERPVWRLGWLTFKAGWPFRQRLNNNINLLLAEFELLAADVKSSVEEESKRRGIFKLESRSSGFMDSTVAVQKQEKTLFHYKNNKSTIFNKKPKAKEQCLEEKAYEKACQFSC